MKGGLRCVTKINNVSKPLLNQIRWREVDFYILMLHEGLIIGFSMKSTETQPLLPYTHMNENNLVYADLRKANKAVILWLLATDSF